jgi:hypothetical protein
MIQHIDHRDAKLKETRMSIIFNKSNILLLLCMGFLLSACNSNENVDSQIVTVIGQPILNSGLVTLEASSPPESGYSIDERRKSSFDFDTNKTDVSDLSKNDLFFSLTVPPTYLALSPTRGAKGAALKTGQASFDPASEQFSFDDCNNLELAHGGNPVPYPGTYYCWRTTEGRLVEFVIEKIEELQHQPEKYRISIRYVIWDTAIK